MEIKVFDNQEIVEIGDFSGDTMKVPKWIFDISQKWQERGWKIFVDLNSDCDNFRLNPGIILLWVDFDTYNDTADALYIVKSRIDHPLLYKDV